MRSITTLSQENDFDSSLNLMPKNQCIKLSMNFEEKKFRVLLPPIVCEILKINKSSKPECK